MIREIQNIHMAKDNIQKWKEWEWNAISAQVLFYRVH